jgi:hypothetical protein
MKCQSRASKKFFEIRPEGRDDRRAFVSGGYAEFVPALLSSKIGRNRLGNGFPEGLAVDFQASHVGQLLPGQQKVLQNH